MNSRNVRDMDDKEFSALPESVREAVEEMVARGYRREHLVVASDNEVFYDPELAMLESWGAAFDKADSS